MLPVSLGKTLIVIGVVLIVVGGLVVAGVHLPFGKLPGDFHIRRGGVDVYFPLGSCLVVSALLSLVFWLLRR
jgi:hypothetical protein